MYFHFLKNHYKSQTSAKMKLSTVFNQGFLQGIAHESFFSSKMHNTKWMQHYFTIEVHYSLG